MKEKKELWARKVGDGWLVEYKRTFPVKTEEEITDLIEWFELKECPRVVNDCRRAEGIEG